MSASVIIPCYLLPDKDRELTGWTMDCIQSFREFCPDAEIVIIDNGSTVDGCMLRHKADLYVGNKTNLGYAPAVNQGLKVAGGEWLVVSNNDVELIDDWVTTAIDAWDEKTGVICSHLLDHDPEKRAGRQVAPHSGYFFGALWMVHRDIVDTIGYLDEGYEIGMFEDKDFAERALQSGYELIKIGWCKHIGNATWGKMPHQMKTYLKNKERFERKWKK